MSAQLRHLRVHSSHGRPQVNLRNLMASKRMQFCATPTNAETHLSDSMKVYLVPNLCNTRDFRQMLGKRLENLGVYIYLLGRSYTVHGHIVPRPIIHSCDVMLLCII
jgi:hypothetical protein